jgi:hypothetical protein
MCDPVSLAVLAGAGSIAAAGADYAGQQATQQAQQNANNEWLAYQQRASANAQAADTAARQKASAAQGSTLNALSPQNQQQTQQTAQASLDANITALGGGAGDQANSEVTSDMASRVTQAARAAQGRIAALAGMASYGGGYGDMGSAATQALASGDEAIRLQSDIRRGNTATLGIAQNVQPVAYKQGSNIAGTVASSLANLAGSAYGRSLKTATG